MKGSLVAPFEARDYQSCHGVVERLVLEDMLALGLVLNTVGLGLFCWLIFALAVYAVPFFVAVSIGMLTFNSGAGVIGALLVGIVAGGIDARYRSNRFRNDTVYDLACRRSAAVFAVPAAIAGYHVVLAMSQIGVPSLAWREVFACLGAVSVGGYGMDAVDPLRRTPPVGTERGGWE